MFVPSPVREIHLVGPITNPKAQISGMAWHGDELLLLPQWETTLYCVAKADLLKAVDGKSDPLTPREISLRPAGLHEMFPGFEGFEGIAVTGDLVYLLAEARNEEGMFGYLFSGCLRRDALDLDVTRVRTLPISSRVKNMGYEGLVIAGDRLIALPEARGGLHMAYCFDFELNPVGHISMPAVDYRLTDSTPVDSEGCFWITNYNHPGDAGMPEAPRVEQLVRLRVCDGAVVFDGEPITIVPDLAAPGRNWEAIAALDDRGFLVMTDEFPRAIFGFIARVDQKV
jgi:hypothetical protein